MAYKASRYTVGYVPHPQHAEEGVDDQLATTMPGVNETSEEKKRTWKSIMKAATQKEEFSESNL